MFETILQNGLKSTTGNILTPQSYRQKWMNLWQNLMSKKNRYTMFYLMLFYAQHLFIFLNLLDHRIAA